MVLSEILNFDRPIYAHTNSKVCAEKETLAEHTSLCQKYFSRLLGKEKLRDALGAMEHALTGGGCADWFWQALEDVVIFHDAGKINPVFQCRAMANTAFDGVRIPDLEEQAHSPLSAYIYFDYQAAQIERLVEAGDIGKDKKLCLYEIVSINSYLIMKHHSDLGSFADFISAIDENGKLGNIDEHVLKGGYSQLYNGKYSKPVLPRYVKLLRHINDSEERRFAKYTYARLVFSLLTACDYYATNEYITGTVVSDFGSVREIGDLQEAFEGTRRMESVRNFCSETAVDDGKDINYLRNMLFYEAERNLEKHVDEDIFFLEAPTGCGKSNVGFNCSFRLAHEGMGKIFYVYPFNNLVEQNKASIKEMFQGKDILKNVAIVNSITPIKRDGKNEENKDEFERDWGECNWSKSLLDRQFLNYPIILTTHVSLFQTMFGTQREALFGFHQLAGSVIVLDEIQSYRNAIWTEIMMYLQYYCRFMHCKVLIMSATLPNLTVLTGKNDRVVSLVNNRERYFNDRRFNDRVRISYELLNDDSFDEDALYEHVKEQSKQKKKILIEFIRKEDAYKFFDRLASDMEIDAVIDRMTGDDNSVDREKILNRIKTEDFGQCGYILVATQVVEAGIDIDMDIGYKDISILDSEEQFIGRINRNYRKDGIVYYFNLCPAAHIYDTDDCRVSEELTLQNTDMQLVLKHKNFSDYYERVMRVLRQTRNNSSASIGIDTFVEEVGSLNFRKIDEWMRLIKEDNWKMSVFLARTIVLSCGETVDGKMVWQQYKSILTKSPKDYAQFRIQLSEISSRLNLFVYQIRKNSNITYSDRVGEIYYIEDGEEFFSDGRLDKKKLEDRGGMFIMI